jgi:sarcosine oxidase subunit gamma
MDETVTTRSGLRAPATPTPGTRAAAALAVRIAPRIATSSLAQALPPATRYILRGGPEVMAAAGQALGLTISQTACRAATSATNATDSGLAALWLGPDEQLLLGPAECDLAAALAPALRDLPHSLVEVSHRQTALQVSGPQATLLLNAGCPLDLDPSAFPIGMCTRTVLAKAEIVLWRTGQDVFHVEVWRSFADYVSSFLAEVAREL